MNNLKFKNKNDKKEFFKLIENNCLKEINKYKYLKMYVFALDEYCETFTFNNKNTLIGRATSYV